MQLLRKLTLCHCYLTCEFLLRFAEGANINRAQEIQVSSFFYGLGSVIGLAIITVFSVALAACCLDICCGKKGSSKGASSLTGTPEPKSTGGLSSLSLEESPIVAVEAPPKPAEVPAAEPVKPPEAPKKEEDKPGAKLTLFKVTDAFGDGGAAGDIATADIFGANEMTQMEPEDKPKKPKSKRGSKRKSKRSKREKKVPATPVALTNIDGPDVGSMTVMT